MGLRQTAPGGMSSLNFEAVNNWEVQIDFDGGSNPVYIGKAFPGVSASAAQWQIMKISWSGSNPTAIKWANDNDSFSFQWTLRATYF